MSITPAQFIAVKTGDFFEDSNGIKWRILATKAGGLLDTCSLEVFACNPKKEPQRVRFYNNRFVDENNSEIAELNHPKAKIILNS